MPSFMTLRPAELADFLGADPPAGVPDGSDPCLEPDPEIPAAPTVVPPTATDPLVTTTATISKLRRKGAFVLTYLHITGSAKATLRVFTRIEGERRGLCADQFQRSGAGRLTVHCRLPRWALERLTDRPLKLKARIGFFPEVGSPAIAFRRLTAVRR